MAPNRQMDANRTPMTTRCKSMLDGIRFALLVAVSALWGWAGATWGSSYFDREEESSRSGRDEFVFECSEPFQFFALQGGDVESLQSAGIAGWNFAGTLGQRLVIVLDVRIVVTNGDVAVVADSSTVTEEVCEVRTPLAPGAMASLTPSSAAYAWRFVEGVSFGFADGHLPSADGAYGLAQEFGVLGIFPRRSWQSHTALATMNEARAREQNDFEGRQVEQAGRCP